MNLRLSRQRALGGDGFDPDPAADPRVRTAARVQHPLGLCPDAAAGALDVASSWAMLGFSRHAVGILSFLLGSISVGSWFDVDMKYHEIS